VTPQRTRPPNAAVREKRLRLCLPQSAQSQTASFSDAVVSLQARRAAQAERRASPEGGRTVGRGLRGRPPSASEDLCVHVTNKGKGQVCSRPLAGRRAGGPQSSSSSTSATTMIATAASATPTPSQFGAP
jgi:hypothetical protein